ncbi:hypothetical protein Tco_1136757 [Tanacetum coccineum]
MSNIEKLKFSALDITGANYIQWTGYVKRHLKSMGALAMIQEGNKCIEETKAKGDVFLQQHIDEMLEFEYSNCDDPSTLWKDLEIRFNNQREVLLPSARDEWNNLRFQDFKKFWSTIVAKTINGEEQLHALVDGKKIIITESSIRRDLQLADEEGVDCLPNSNIFEQLILISPKTTAWNEFSSTMASTIIYQQLDGMSTHKRIYIAPSHTKKIFGNMRRVGKGFSGRVTPLFQTMVVQNQSQLGEGSAIPTDPHHTPTFIQPSTQPQKTQQPRKPKRKDTQVPQPSDPIENVADEAVHKELGDSLVRAATTASSLEAEQDSGNINKTQSKATPNESSSQGTNSGGGPWCQETMGDTIAQTRFESVSKHSNDSLLARGNTLQSDEDRLKLDELMALCTTLQNRVLDLEKTKTTQHNEIASLKRRVKKLEKKDSAAGDIVSTASAATTVSAATTTTATIKTVDDITLAQALEEMESTKPKKKGVVIQELGESTTTISSQQSEEKGKGILIKPMKPMNKKNQIRLNEETALNLQAEFNEEERLAREKAEKKKLILP